MAKRERAAWELDAGAADTARLLMLLAQAQQQHLLQQQQQHAAHHHGHGHGVGVPFPVAVGHHRDATAHGHGRVFECKTCSRQFPTFQALGGHRASHKRPRVVLQQQPAAAAAADDHVGLCLGRQPLQQLQLPTTTTTQQQPAAAKPRVHECPVCGLEFAIGQALGGHMRRHRAEAEADAAALASKVRPQAAAAADSNKACDVAGGICLDLNLTPSENCAKCRSVVVLGAAAAAAGQQQGVHKTLAMLDCSL